MPEWIANNRRNRQFGLDPAAAIPANEGGMTIWFVPGRHYVCWSVLEPPDARGFVIAGAGVCGSVANVLSGNLLGGFINSTAKRVTVVGLAPDTNHGFVYANLADGSVRPVPVAQGIYSIKMHGPDGIIRSVTLKDAAGVTHTYRAP